MARLDSTVQLEGALFSRDFLMRLGAPIGDLPHSDALSYGLAQGRTRDAIGASWNALAARYHRLQELLGNVPETDAATAITRREWILPLLEELRFGRVQSAAPLRAELENADGTHEKIYPISHGWNRVPLHLLGWNVPLDKRSPGVTGAAQAAPHALVQEALNRSGAHLWAILCNGRKLRVLRDSAAMARQSYVEFDLQAIFDHENTADFALLWLLCHASRFETQAPAVSAAPPAAQEVASTRSDDESEIEAESEEAAAATAIIESWFHLANTDGQRALDHLRKGVEAAIGAVATGFLAHPDNQTLRENLQSGALAPLDFYKLNLRLIYRLLFVLVGEARDGLLLRDENAAHDADLKSARENYRKYFSLQRLKTLAGKQRGGAHADAYEALKALWKRLQRGEKALALPALGGFLFEPIELDDCTLSNAALYGAMRHLCFVTERGRRRPVNFQIKSEELGSVYESLLEMTPRLDVDARTFFLENLAGNERKTTGSYYTPEGLVKSLLDSALDPVLQRASAGGEAAILNLKVCDPACGSGHFLTAAARRIARVLALQRSGGDEPSPAALQRALRDVVARCIFGVDLNPMAVELCKVALWMESLDPNRPLSFLDAHIRCGNALLGASPELLENGIPDDAFSVLEGDDKSAVSDFRKRNKAERAGQRELGLYGDDDWKLNLGELQREYSRLESADDNDLEALRRKEETFHNWMESAPRRVTHGLADAWCAAFVWRKVKDDDAHYLAPITQGVFEKLRATPFSVELKVREEIARLAAQYRWFHWHLEFPGVFAASTRDDENASGAASTRGFDVVLGNPPWERVKLQEKEWFSARVPEIAGAANASARKAMIDALLQSDAEMHAAFLAARRQAEGESHFARKSGRYPLCGAGDVNTYALFAELNRALIDGNGHVGCIVPSGIATDDTTKHFFADLTQSGTLVSLFDFENRLKIFPAVDSRVKFCLLTMAGEDSPLSGAQFVFFAHRAEETEDAARRFSLSGDDIALLNPNTRTCPIFRGARDAEITKAIYRRVPVLLDERDENGNAWKIRFATMFHMSNDSGLFERESELRAEGFSRRGNVWEKGGEAALAEVGNGEESTSLARPRTIRYLPLYEAKMLHHFDHRWATYASTRDDGDDPKTRDVTLDEKQNPDFVVQPRYWVHQSEVAEKLREKWDKEWLLGFRRISNTTNERTFIADIFPVTAAGDSVFFMLPKCNNVQGCVLLANLTSFVFDYVTRQKMGGSNLNFYIVQQLPVLPPSVYEVATAWTGGRVLADWISERVVELVYTSHDVAAFARDVWADLSPAESGAGDDVARSPSAFSQAPFAWDVARRFALRCELDAAFFHLYGVSRADAEYVLSTFPIIERKDRAAHGEFRTARTILAFYDAMAA